MIHEILRPIIGRTFGVLYNATKLRRFDFMRRYLLGNGDSVEYNDTQLVVEDFLAIIERDLRYGSDDLPFRCLFRHTEYDGRGFYGRPELFYLVGSFWFDIYVDSDNGIVYFTTIDRYDWHQVESYYDNEMMWHFSPLPIVIPFADKVAKIANKLFGYELLRAGAENNSLSVSNEFFFKLNGRPFDTIVRWQFDISKMWPNERRMLLDLDRDQENFLNRKDEDDENL